MFGHLLLIRDSRVGRFGGSRQIHVLSAPWIQRMPPAWVGAMADNVWLFTKRAESRPKGGEGVSRPFIIYPFHGPPGKATQAADA